MVALRKDVKVGFVVGGIMLSVVGVYFALSAVTGKPSKPTAETATLQVPPSDSSKTPSVSPIKPSTPANAGGARTDRPTTPTNVATGAPGAASTGNGDDVWSNAFTTGDLHPTRSVTPDLPTKTSREPAAKPSDVIRALNNPADGGTTPPQSTASATDNSSGSLVGGGVPPTMTRTPADSTKTVASGAGKTHVVAAGETFSAIAEAEYGSPNLYKLIVDANPTVDAGKLKVGTSLTIPPHEKTTAPLAKDASASVDATKQYVVKPGDSLHKIASTLYGSSSEWQAIYDAKKAQIGESPANIKVGMKLTLPKPPMKK